MILNQYYRRMEDRYGDMRVPLISCIFCICVTGGGILLVIYLFVSNLSQPWFLPAALILVGSPWLFWFLTYMYTCIKLCCCSSKLDNRQISQRSSNAATMANARNVSTRNSTSSQNNNYDEKHVKFAEVVEVGESGHSRGSKQDEWEIHPLNRRSKLRCPWTYQDTYSDSNRWGHGCMHELSLERHCDRGRCIEDLNLMDPIDRPLGFLSRIYFWNYRLREFDIVDILTISHMHIYESCRKWWIQMNPLNEVWWNF